MASMEDLENIIQSRESKGKVSSEDVNKTSLNDQEAVDKIINERRPLKLIDIAGRFTNKEDFISKAGALLELSALPLQRVEASIANVGLEMQRGNFNPSDLGKDFMKGFKGEKVGELGDIMRGSQIKGLNSEAAAAAIGLTATFVAPLKAMNTAVNNISRISKATDKGLKTAGNLLTKAADDAVVEVGKNLDIAYKSPVKTSTGFVKANDVSVDGIKILDKLSDLDSSVIKHIERELGQNLDNYLLELNISKARKLKGIIGELRPNSFSKSDRGAVEIILDKKINKAYASIKQSMGDALGKEYKGILEADEAFTQVKNASNFIKRKTFDPVLLQSTKASNVAKGLSNTSDLSSRTALNIIKGASRSSQKGVNQAVRELSLFNRREAIRGGIEKASQAAIFGGAAGAVGGKALQSITEKAQ